jgi:hypothetical protein
MKASSKQIKKLLVDKSRDLHLVRVKFILENVPRLHRFLMDALPWTTKLFGYLIAENEDDPRKLTLIRNKKVLAKNF